LFKDARTRDNPSFGRDPPYHQRPLLFYHKGRIILSFSRVAITGSAASPRNPRIPPITEAQAEALDAVQFIAQRDQIKMSMMPGDARFVNNLAVMHCRDSFEDNERTSRHLIRLWLRSSRAAWELPPVLQLAEDRVYEPDEDIEDIWAIEPPPQRGPNIPKGLLHKTSCE
jgi:Taurine catabolism dioxygenase TauD, TfdA family